MAAVRRDEGTRGIISGDNRSGVVIGMSVGSDVAEACHRDRRSR